MSNLGNRDKGAGTTARQSKRRTAIIVEVVDEAEQPMRIVVDKKATVKLTKKTKTRKKAK